jgi:hypothetical protein
MISIVSSLFFFFIIVDALNVKKEVTTVDLVLNRLVKN